MDERRELGETGSVASRRDRGELAAHVVRDGMLELQQRRLYRRRGTHRTRPTGSDDAMTGNDERKAVRRATEPAARCAFGWPASAATSP